ncbi:MAG: amidase, partial [Alphaproteobacteria bacterium]
MKTPSYDPRTFQGLEFSSRRAAFAEGADDARAYLERCLEAVEAREPVVRALASLNVEAARAAAD